MNVLSSMAKALTAVVAAAYVAYQAAVVASSPGGEAVTGNEWISLIVAGIVTGFAVWAIPNTPTPTK